MKKLIIISALLLSSIGSSAIGTPCKATTKAGTACKRNAALSSEYCKQHDPASLRCGAKTVAGGTCKNLVKVAGATCKSHTAKP